MITNGGYTYDALNRLTAVETVGGASRPDAIRAEFFYDPRNRCILRKYYTRGSQSQWVLNTTDSRALTYDSAWNLLTERTLGGQQVGEYIHGQRTDEILRAELTQLPLKPSTSTTAVYPLADGLGSTVALTDEQGRVTQRYRYTAYGTPTVLTAGYLPTSNSDLLKTYRFLFTGREWLSSVGLNDHRNRYYSPVLGRWQTTDPIGFGGGAENLYTYVINFPINSVDFYGLSRATVEFTYRASLAYTTVSPNGAGGEMITYTRTEYVPRKAYVDFDCKCTGTPNVYSINATGYGWEDGGDVHTGFDLGVGIFDLSLGDDLTTGLPESGPNYMNLPLIWTFRNKIGISLSWSWLSGTVNLLDDNPVYRQTAQLRCP